MTDNFKVLVPSGGDSVGNKETYTVVVSNMVWLDKNKVPAIMAHYIKNDLTIVPKAVVTWIKQKPSMKLFKVTDDLVGIPRSYYQNVLKNKPERYKFNEVVRVKEGKPFSDFESNLKLRQDDQEPLVQDVIRMTQGKPYFGGQIQAKTGFGKTIVMLELARRLGRKTMIVVDQENLMEQWLERINTFFPNARTGIVQSNKCQYQDKDFVVGMVQSLMNENGDKYPEEFYEDFGTVLYDECHSLSTESFYTSIQRFHAKYMFGCTATPDRADGCQVIFRYFVGPIVAIGEGNNVLKPIVYVKRTGYVPPDRLLKEEFKPKLLTAIAESNQRTILIAKDIVKAVKTGRKCLILSDRINILQNIVSYLRCVKEEGFAGKTFALYLGGMTVEEKKAASKKDVICATYQVAKKGLDIVDLDTLFFATPVSEPTQPLGRISRPCETKKTPMAVDYVDDNLEPFKKNYKSRLRYYNKLGLELIGQKEHLV